MIQGDTDIDLADCPDEAFDYVILSQTLHAPSGSRRKIEKAVALGA